MLGKLPRSMLVLLGAALLIPAAGAADAASLTRIETRPFYGAIVTEEEGVRVYRPLPPHRHIIINPEGRTPLNLTIEDRNVSVQHYHYGAVGDVDGTGGYIGGYGYRSGVVGHRRQHVRRAYPTGHMIHVPSRVPGVGSSRR